MTSCLLGVIWLLATGPQAAAAEPVVSVWYRGTPTGVPREDDLAAIRAQGFTGVIWPADHSAGLAQVQRLASAVGLTVSVRAAPVHLTRELAGNPPERVDIVTSRVAAAEIPALVWRAVGRGARGIAFDPGPVSGSGLTDRNGRRLAWVGAGSRTGATADVQRPALRRVDRRPGGHTSGAGAAGCGRRAARSAAGVGAGGHEYVECPHHRGRGPAEVRRAGTLEQPARWFGHVDAEPAGRAEVDVRARAGGGGGVDDR